jgi:hypothetical protein
MDYCIKPLPFSKWYSNAAKANCDLPNLNLVFDDTGLQTCPGAFSGIYSPRRGGVFDPHSGKKYILNRLPPLLTREQMARCSDPKFYHEHEDSFWRTIEKRALRQGRNFYCKSRSHRAAARCISALEKRESNTNQAEISHQKAKRRPRKTGNSGS